MRRSLLMFCLLLAFVGCVSRKYIKSEITKSGLKLSNFDTVMEGKKVSLFTLQNSAGMEVCITNFGGRIVSMMVPNQDKSRFYDVVQGFDKIGDYKLRNNCFGAIIGRFANRIKDGRLPILGDTLYLPVNEQGNTTHGGVSPWHNRVFTPVMVKRNKLVLSLFSPDGEGGFSGAVTLQVTYSLSKNNSLMISYQAMSTKPTVINLTNHSFFNLSGRLGKSIENEGLHIFAKKYLGTDEEHVADGSVVDLKGSPLDFGTLHVLKDCFDSKDKLIAERNGIDFCYVLDGEKNSFKKAAVLKDYKTGIEMTVSTDQPGLWIYTSNVEEVQDYGKKHTPYRTHSGICFETQHFPDAPNHPEWGSTLLMPGDTLKSKTVFSFK